MSVTGMAQVSNHALGLRIFGDTRFNGVELSYQKGLKRVNRFELDLSFGFRQEYNRIFLVGVYQWDWNIDGGLNWYVGPGASISLSKYRASDRFVNVGIGGQLGLEYNFSRKLAPLLVSLDVRPMYDLIGEHAGFGWAGALGFRYTW